MSRRIGAVAIVIDDRQKAASQVNEILSKYGNIIIGRMGVPRREDNMGVISLLVEGDTDEIGAITGELGSLEKVNVKSALTSKEVED
ncbi:TM1266 family iron-only hydrogenase system putative regulator [Halarsenatibacter silvermanii]|uniref:Putative iron-only hydrogenase system regulator n=1 Tax=Halarsenatibacter silvermanii TaxID=321763 RepID=A0A1G9KQ85_9FIRM|nr:TM1266 family iron-only hydrogenase system putative regulator [Halarsenatibacter silvermanii]SDL51908.1 putative iron-only hydrogenase system regulator [Halarsenatibacter silvermanii]